MTRSRIRYSEHFKRQAVSRVTAEPEQVTRIAHELGLDPSLLYRWRKRYAAPPALALLPTPNRRGIEGEVDEEPEVNLAAHAPHLRQSLLDTIFSLTAAIRDAAPSASLGQLAAALGVVMDRLLRLEALASSVNETHPGEQLIRIEYTHPDGTIHFRPPWAADDPAFEVPVVPGQVHSPFWENRDGGQADNPEDDPARG